MRKLLLTFALLLTILSLRAESAFTFTPYGFIRNDFYYDSRQNFETASGLFYIIPKDENKNELGDDLNDKSSSGFLSIAARLGLRVSGPDLGKAKSQAVFETDFAGFNASTTMLRIRQAYCKLTWDKYESDTTQNSKSPKGQNALIIGQTWHPLFGDVVPDIQSLATGSPFQPFNRSPQVRFNFGVKSFRLSLAALYQLQYTSIGENGASTAYLVNNKLPELFIGADFKNSNWMVGAGADFLQIRPRIYGSVPYFDGIKDTVVTGNVDEQLNSWTFQGYLQFTSTDKRLSVKLKSTFGENMAHLLMLSGYGVSSINEDGSFEYTNLRNTTSWANIVYKLDKFKFGVFGGYMKNLGSDDELLSSNTTYVFGFNNIDYVYRIAPMVCYERENWSLGVEYERTTAAYGTLDLTDGKVKDTHDVTNNRLVGVLMYKF